METNIKIFLVDDDPFSLNSYKEQLQNYGYHNITLLHSGEECIRHLNEKPQVIFLDHQMNGMNGLDVLQKIKQYYPQIKVVIVSGRECVRTAVSSLKCGAYDYIIKGDEEVKRMRSILKQITLEEKRRLTKRSIFKRFLDINPMSLLVLVLFIAQSGVLISYYASPLTSVLSVIILFLVSGIGFVIRALKLQP